MGCAHCPGATSPFSPSLLCALLPPLPLFSSPFFFSPRFPRDTGRCSRRRMMLLCAAWGLVCHRPGKRRGAVGRVNYLPCCGELFALFPFPVNKFLRYSTDQSKLTERMWSFYCVNLDLLSRLRWHWHLYIIFILLPVEQFQKYLQGKWMSPSVPGIINVPLSEVFHW